MASRYGGQTQQKQVLRLSNKQSGTRSSEVIREWGWQTNGVVCCCLKTHTSLGLPHDLASLSHHLKAHTITLSCVSRNYSNCTKLPEANTRVVAHWFGMTLHRQPVWMASLATPSHRNAHHTTVNRNTSSIRHLTPTYHRLFACAYGMATSAMRSLRKLRRQRQIQFHTKPGMEIHTAPSLPILNILLYGSKTWTPQAWDTQKLQAFHVCSQRQLLSVLVRFHVQHSSLRSDSFHLSHFARVACQNNSTPAICTLAAPLLVAERCPPPSWKRPLARPHHSWTQWDQFQLAMAHGTWDWCNKQRLSKWSNEWMNITLQALWFFNWCPKSRDVPCP